MEVEILNTPVSSGEDKTELQAPPESRNLPGALGPKKTWEDEVYDCNNFASSTCITYMFCLPCSMLCCLPHHAAAMASKIGWRGFSNGARRDKNPYDRNRNWMQRFAYIGLFLVMAILFINFYLKPQCLRLGEIPSDTGNAPYTASNEQKLLPDECYAGCSTKLVGDGVCDLVCNVTQCNYDGGDCDPQRAIAERANCAKGWTTLVIIVGVLLGVMEPLYVLFLVLLRYKMRTALNIKASCCTCCGEVGEVLEDGICMVSCFPCAMSQMEHQVNTPVQYCYSGTAPSHLDSAVVVAV